MWANNECQDCSMQKCAKDALLPDACITAGLTPEQCLDPEDCAYLFQLWNLSDVTVGVILIVFSILLLCCSLICMVKLLISLLKGAMAVVVRKVINPNFDNLIGNYFYGYLKILIGAVLTFFVQSSSVFTSALTPLVGIGLISVSLLLCHFIPKVFISMTHSRLTLYIPCSWVLILEPQQHLYWLPWLARGKSPYDLGCRFHLCTSSSMFSASSYITQYPFCGSRYLSARSLATLPPITGGLL